MNRQAPQDFLGRPIAIGVTVVYPTRTGSSMWLCKSVVSDFRYHDDISAHPWTLTVRVEDRNGKTRTATGVPATRCVVV